MFICPNCKSEFSLPECHSCGSAFEKKDDIWQLSNDPDIVVDGDSDKYVGYEYIGGNYSGNRKYLIEERDCKIAGEIAHLTGNGIFLDLACGDGRIAVPVASFGSRVVAADISNSMLKILKAKAISNGIGLTNTTLCRMNALNIPIKDNSINCVAANSVLHLISNPEKVIHEIYRVLRPDGVFVCEDDAPNKDASEDFDNFRYNEIVNEMYSKYWEYMKVHNVLPVKYSWKFNRNALCDNIFSSKETLFIKHNKHYSIMLKDGFLPRFLSRGFSDQVEVPEDIHDQVIGQVFEELKRRYGEDFDTVPCRGIEPDILLTIYVK